MPKEMIIDSIARTLWACSWADWQEELPSDDPRKDNLSGCEIFEVMPEVPSEALEHATKLFNELAKLNNGEEALCELVDQVNERDGSDTEYLAHYLTMESLGHGVSYCDDYPEHGINTLSYCEVIFDGESFDLCC